MAEITTDVLISCSDENRRGGIKAVYVINKDDIVSFTPNATNQSYTAVTLSTTNDVFYEIEAVSYTHLTLPTKRIV